MKDLTIHRRTQVGRKQGRLASAGIYVTWGDDMSIEPFVESVGDWGRPSGSKLDGPEAAVCTRRRQPIQGDHRGNQEFKLIWIARE